MDIRHTPTHSPLTLRVSGVTENSAFPTRLRLSPSALTLSLRADSLTLTALPHTPPRHHDPHSHRRPVSHYRRRAASHSPTSLPPADGASEMRYSLETPSVRSAAEDAWGYCRHTLSRRFGDALLPHQPDRALLTSSPLAVVAESDRASGHAFC